jgi:hypothetical protein
MPGPLAAGIVGAAGPAAGAPGVTFGPDTDDPPLEVGDVTLGPGTDAPVVGLGGATFGVATGLGGGTGLVAGGFTTSGSVRGLTASLWTVGGVGPWICWVPAGFPASAASAGVVKSRTRAERRRVIMATSFEACHSGGTAESCPILGPRRVPGVNTPRGVRAPGVARD